MSSKTMTRHVSTGILALGFLFSQDLSAQGEPRNAPAEEAITEKAIKSQQISVEWDNQPLVIRTLDERSDTTSNIPHVLSFASILVALFAAYWSYKGVGATLAQTINEAEVKQLQEKLDTFYGPYIQLSESNRLLIEELRSRQARPAQFRTLVELIRPDWRTRFDRSDQTIIEEIVRNDTQLRKLIHDKSGLVDASVVPYLARASAHFRIVKLAFDGKLSEDAQRFDRYIYPRQLDEVLNLEVRRLISRIQQLRKYPNERLTTMQPLEIPHGLTLPDWPR